MTTSINPSSFEGGPYLTKEQAIEMQADQKAGSITPQPAIANLAAAPTEADFNGLLAALRSAGVIAAS